MFAVIKTGGKQYRVAANDVLKIEKVAGEVGDIVEIGHVLAHGEGEHVDVRRAVRRRRAGDGGSGRAGPRQDRHRFQEAPPPEFAPQARPSPVRDHGADRRDPDRRSEAVEEGRRRRPKPAKKEGRCEGRADGRKSREEPAKAEAGRPRRGRLAEGGRSRRKAEKAADG